MDRVPQRVEQFVVDLVLGCFQGVFAGTDEFETIDAVVDDVAEFYIVSASRQCNEVGVIGGLLVFCDFFACFA